MDGCSLNDAFPDGAFGSPGCNDRGAAEESRRQEKKKARRCRGPQLAYLNDGMNFVGPVDPDRPSTKPMAPVPALNKATGMYEHQPVSQQYNYESFVGDMADLPAIRQDAAGPTALQKTNAPAFFGASPQDDEPNLKVKRGLTEAFQSGAAPFTDVIGSEEAYKLVPDFSATFANKGAAKAEGTPIGSGPSPVGQETAYLTPTGMMPNSILPVPNVDVYWKENGLTGGSSSFFSALKAPGGQAALGSVTEGPDDAQSGSSSKHEVLSKLDKIFARLDDMESQKTENAQTEVLLFIMTGLGVIFLMDIGCRAALRR